jgi:hypothetical protein
MLKKLKGKNNNKKYGFFKISSKKKKARQMRTYAHYVKGEDKGTTSTHLMVSDILDNKTKKPREKGPYKVWPSIITDKSGYKSQKQDEAEKRGEVFEFKNRKRAEKFAYGSWKKGRDKKEAMKAFRNRNK